MSSDRLFTPRFFVMCGFTFTVFLSAFQLLPTAPFRILELGGSTFASGLFLGFLTYASATSAPLTGAIADHIGQRRTLIVASGVILLCAITFRSWRAVVVALSVMSLPLFVRSARVAFQELNPRLEQIARTLGAGRLRVFLTITLPLASRGLVAGMVLAFARALGEFGATLVMAYHPNTVPVFLWVQLTSEGLMAALPLALFLVFLGLVAVCAVYFFGQFTSTDSAQRRT